MRLPQILKTNFLKKLRAQIVNNDKTNRNRRTESVLIETTLEVLNFDCFLTHDTPLQTTHVGPADK